MNKTEEGPERQKEPKRKGRPTHAEHLGRQKANSFESIIDSFKRKREEKKDKIRTEKELLEKFQKTRAVSRPPTKRKSSRKDGRGKKYKKRKCARHGQNK